MKLLGVAGQAATSITLDGDHDIILIAYDGGDAFLYRLQPGNADGATVTAEIEPLFFLDQTTAMTAGDLVKEDFLLA